MENNNTPLLVVDEIHKHFGKNKVLNGLNFQIGRQEIHGFVGLNGAGKTTTIECILGLQKFDSGSAKIMGVTPSKLHTTNGQVAVVFDSPCIRPNLTVRQTLEYARLTCGSTHTRPLGDVEEKLGISRYQNYKIKNLSLGNRRRASIAQALIGKPAFIILDEPFSSLDAGGVDDLLSLITALNQKEGTTFLLASHQLPYLERICTHISILHQGNISISLRVEELLDHKQTRAVVYINRGDKSMDILSKIPGITLCDTHYNGGGILVELDDITTAQLNRELNRQKIDVYELIRQRPSLDSLFRKVTGSNTHA